MCERIPYLILPVRQLLGEPFGCRGSDTSEPSDKQAGLSLPICGSDTSELSGKPPGRLEPTMHRRQLGLCQTVYRSVASKLSRKVMSPHRIVY